ncbi:hypothetical protein [Ancylobacter pratisalsi]|uniref:Uncharacterized protein n=1 Tax=Ancylobacter pratisalsi TaxID=1745854 RepID=A0A6P1YL55_9HYPH|nr:hypothetical protein [Ancylobacter pratisalsi]QIB33865.1 hypothetical protein G3A50_09200 [Ancylobacter pratisalsi]
MSINLSRHSTKDIASIRQPTAHPVRTPARTRRTRFEAPSQFAVRSQLEIAEVEIVYVSTDDTC